MPGEVVDERDDRGVFSWNEEARDEVSDEGELERKANGVRGESGDGGGGEGRYFDMKTPRTGRRWGAVMDAGCGPSGEG
jgi:hypothetical protein